MKVAKKKTKATGKKVKIEGQSLEIQLVDLDLIQESGDIPLRKLDKPWVRDLAKDITNNGLDQPIVLWNGGDTDATMEIEGEEYPVTILLAGQHRVAALKSMRNTDKKAFNSRFHEGIPCVVRSVDLAGALFVSLRENVQRKDSSAADIFPVLMSLRDDHNLKATEIAKRIGKSKSWVSQMFAIDEAGDELSDAVKKGKVSVTEAKDAAAAIRKGKKSGKKVDAKVEISKAKKKGAARAAKGAQRADRRVSLKKCWARYSALPALAVSKYNAILEGMIAYVLNEPDAELPVELQEEEAVISPKKTAKKNGKKTNKKKTK